MTSIMNLSEDTMEFIPFLSIQEASNLSITNKIYKHMVKQFYRGNLSRIKCSLKEYTITFPNATFANLRHLDMVDDDFKYLSMFRTLYIDENRAITNRGIQKLIKMKDLTVRNCSNIGDGLCNLTSLIRLEIYNLHKLTDEGLKNLTNVEELHMTFGNITDIGISYLVNVKKMHLLSCDNITFKNVFLPKLELLSLCNIQITDENFVSLSNLLNISIYGCKINGNGLQYLTKCKIITIYQSPIIDDELDYLYTLKDLTQVNIYRCNLITRNKKKELKTVFGNKCNTD